MINLEQYMLNYMEYCTYQKNLNHKTIKAYHIDLNQFLIYMHNGTMLPTKDNISNYITILHKTYKPKSCKRKIASLKAFFTYLEFEEFLIPNPFDKIRVKFQEPFLLPRTISLQDLQKIFNITYDHAQSKSLSSYQQKIVTRNVAVLELLFAAGLRVSELSSLKQSNVDLEQGTIKIYGKGSKERMIQIANIDVLNALRNYRKCFFIELQSSDFFFVNRLNHCLSEQSVRMMIKRYCDLAHISEHITPHMFRHTFATMLLEEDVDIRYIQQILGHSSIVTTQIYTHVTSTKQREILTMKHPRNKI